MQFLSHLRHVLLRDVSPVNFEDERRVPMRLPLGNDAGVDAAFETMNDGGEVSSIARAFSGHPTEQIFRANSCQEIEWGLTIQFQGKACPHRFFDVD